MSRVDTGIDRGHEAESKAAEQPKGNRDRKSQSKNKKQEATQKLTEATQNSDRAG